MFPRVSFTRKGVKQKYTKSNHLYELICMKDIFLSTCRWRKFVCVFSQGLYADQRDEEWRPDGSSILSLSSGQVLSF